MLDTSRPQYSLLISRQLNIYAEWELLLRCVSRSLVMWFWNVFLSRSHSRAQKRTGNERVSGVWVQHGRPSCILSPRNKQGDMQGKRVCGWSLWQLVPGHTDPGTQALLSWPIWWWLERFLPACLGFGYCLWQMPYFKRCSWKTGCHSDFPTVSHLARAPAPIKASSLKMN